MRKWILPIIAAWVLVSVAERPGWRDYAWWAIPCALFPIALTAMIVRKELSIFAVTMLVLLSGVMALLLKFST